MAICHISASVVKRSAGHSAVAAAAYRAGEKLADDRTGKVHDYSRRRGVDATEIIAPPGAPAWALNRETLWNKVEAAEPRADSQVAREIRVAIPVELSRDAGRDLVRDYVKREFVDRGMVADIAWHDEDGRNPHAHILLTMRQIDRDDFGPKVRKWNDKKTLTGWREAWADSANQALEAHGSPERIDHRTLEAQRTDAEARGDHEAALRLDRPPTMHRGRTLTHHPEAAPNRHLRFADAEAERAIAIGIAEETIQLESFVAGEAVAQKRLVREIDKAMADAIDAIPEETRAKGLAHAAQPPRDLPTPPTPPTIERKVLVAEVIHRMIDAIPEETRAKGLAHAAQPPRDLPIPPTIERDVLTAEATRREETRAAAEAAEAADREDRQLLDAIPEETRAVRFAHAAQSPRALPTPPTIERNVLTTEATRREEKRAAAAAADKGIETDRLAAAEATRRDETLMHFERRVLYEIDREALALAKRHPDADARLWAAVRTELEAHPVTLEIAGAPEAVRQLPTDFAAEVVAEAGQQSPRPSRRTPPPRPEVIAETVKDVRDRVQSVIREMAAEQDIELPAAAVTDTPSVTVTDTPSVTDTPTPPRAQGAEVVRPSAVVGMPGGAAPPKPTRTGEKER